MSSPRRCYLVRLVDLSVSMYRDLLKFDVAGIVIVVPSNFAQLSAEVIEQIHSLEQVMLEDTTTVPVYFINETDDLREVYDTVKESAESLGQKTSTLQSRCSWIYFSSVYI